MSKSKTNIITTTLLLGLLTSSCNTQKQTRMQNPEFPAFSYEGHRGMRGLYPENSIEGMKRTIDLPKVTTLEMDCHITKDKKVIVYHDDYLNPKFVTYKDGSELKGKDIKGTIYGYTWKELGNFDLGLKGNVDFPEQKKAATPIALLKDLIKESEAYAKEKRSSPMFYNIETKSKEGKDHEWHPAPQEFSDLILEVVIEQGIAARTVIQSFDKRTIQYINKNYPQIKTSYLIGAKNTKSIKELVAELGFTPFIISPHHSVVNTEFVKEAHNLGIKIIPWTVNDKKGIIAQQALKVDGIISDYPNLF